MTDKKPKTEQPVGDRAQHIAEERLERLANKPKFPKYKEPDIIKRYGLQVWDDYPTGGCIKLKDARQALTRAERAGELTGMRNQHEIEKTKPVYGIPTPIGSWVSAKDYKKAKERIAQLEKEVALLQDVEVHLQVCENNKKALVDICEQYKQENKRLKAELSK
jgi:hypothetical protein